MTTRTDVPARTAVDHLADARQMVLRSLDPSLSETDRSVRARTAGEHVTDLRDLVRFGELIMSGATLDAIRNDDAARTRTLAREALAELRATIALTDVGERHPNEVANLPTGLARSLPLIREVARPNTDNHKFLIPDMPTGETAGYVVVKDQAPSAIPTSPIVIGAGTTFARFQALAVAMFSLPLVDGLTEIGSAYVDQILADIADRAAEKQLGTMLLAAAPAATAVAGGDILAALTTAEGLSATAMDAMPDLLLVNPADLSKVRRAVSPVWQIGPVPRIAPSVSMPAGTSLFVGLDALLLYSTPLRTSPLTGPDVPEGYTAPATLARWVLADRDVQFAVRRANGLRKVTGI